MTSYNIDEIREALNKEVLGKLYRVVEDEDCSYMPLREAIIQAIEGTAGVS